MSLYNTEIHTNGEISSRDIDANMAPQAGNASHHIIDHGPKMNGSQKFC